MIPSFPLSSGASIPGLGLGTFGSDRYSPEQIGQAVEEAIGIGYRHIDCAAVYGNEQEVGAAIKRSGVGRGELWVTSKLWNDKHSEAEVIPACERSLANLGLDYLDLYLIHWPFPNHHAPGVDVGSRDPHAVPYSHDRYLGTWRQLETLVKRGLVRHIGTSNMTVSKLEGLLRDAEIRPAASQMELHPHFQQPELFQFVKEHGIVPIGYSPLGSPSRPERDRTEEDSVDLEDQVILEISERTGLSPSGVAIRWAIQRGHIPIPFSVKRRQIEDSFLAASSPALSARDMDAIASIDRGCRLIKGQVFLWPGAESWQELWA